MLDHTTLLENVISMDDFRYNWRFTDPSYSVLPKNHLDQLMPLNVKASNFLWDFLLDVQLHDDEPFKSNLFSKVEEVSLTQGNKDKVRKWLYHRGLPFSKNVYLSWQPDEAMIVPWKLLVKYFDDFYYPGPDDLTVFDESLNWALLLHHEDTAYFGSNKRFTPTETAE